VTQVPKHILDKYDLKKVFKVTDPRDLMILDVAALVHEDDWLGAGSLYASFVRRKDPSYPNPRSKEDVIRIVTELVHWCLDHNRYWLAARLLWSENQFDIRPRAARDVFEAWEKNAALVFMGAASMSKSYSSGVWLLLDWIRDPEFTCVKVLGPSEKHLADNLFTHLINLHESASIPLPGETGDLWIGLNRRNRFSSISGVIVPLGRKAAGRLQGTKAGNKKRKTPHPKFGTTGRLRVFLDESEKIPAGIWKDIDNIFANIVGTEVFKIGLAYNPENQNGESAQRSEPTDGWANFDMDRDFKWRSKRGWAVTRLDGFLSENVVEGYILFPGLQSKEGIEKVIENAGGVGSPGYFTMARAAFPPSAATLTVFTQAEIQNAIGTFVFVGPTRPVAGADLALEGGDSPIFVLGEYGNAVGFKRTPTLKHPQGEYIEFRNADGEPVARPALQVLQSFKLDAGDAVTTAASLRNLSMKCNVEPGMLMVDRTGNGQGTLDIMRSMWSADVMGVNYSESASELKILEEDEFTCKQEYDRVHSELHFALKKWMRHHLLKISPLVDMTKAAAQLTDRRYAPGKVNKIEKKKDFKDRNGGVSPDESDALTLVVHGVRVRFSVTPSMKLTSSQDALSALNLPGADDGEAYCFVDVTNRLERDL
jgi:hypothetical protein